jgi:hypothetical protein
VVPVKSAFYAAAALVRGWARSDWPARRPTGSPQRSLVCWRVVPSCAIHLKKLSSGVAFLDAGKLVANQTLPTKHPALRSRAGFCAGALPRGPLRVMWPRRVRDTNNVQVHLSLWAGRSIEAPATCCSFCAARGGGGGGVGAVAALLRRSVSTAAAALAISRRNPRYGRGNATPAWRPAGILR